jgi:ferrous-iron efflux pump FieF
MSLKTRTVITAMLASLALTLVKLIVGLLSSSIAVLASALDSFTDTCSMAISLIAVRSAEKPADEKHQFGHGKAEPIAGLFQAAFIAISAGYLIVQAFHRVVHGYTLQDEGVAIAVIALALVVSIVLARKMKRVSECTASMALEACSLNYGADVWTNAGVLIALGLEIWAKVKNADPIISILVSIYIIVSALRIGRDAISQLMDRSLPGDMIGIIDRCVRAHTPKAKGYHRLRTRSVGAEKEIEFHLEMDKHLSFEQAHLITETIIADIKRDIPGAYVTIHSDPV